MAMAPSWADRAGHAVLLAADPRFRPVTDPAELTRVRQRYSLPARFILYLGGFDVRKNVPLLIKAFRGVAARSDVTLVIAGSLPDRPSDFAPDPRPLVQQLGLSGRVRFLGLVAGEFLIAGIWVVVSALTGTRGYRFFLT